MGLQLLEREAVRWRSLSSAASDSSGKPWGKLPPRAHQPSPSLEISSQQPAWCIGSHWEERCGRWVPQLWKWGHQTALEMHFLRFLLLHGKKWQQYIWFDGVVDQYRCLNNYFSLCRWYPALCLKPSCSHFQRIFVLTTILTTQPHSGAKNKSNHTAALLLLYFSGWHITFSPDVYVGFQLVISLPLSAVKIWLYNVHQLQAIIAQGDVRSVGAAEESHRGNVRLCWDLMEGIDH